MKPAAGRLQRSLLAAHELAPQQPQLHEVAPLAQPVAGLAQQSFLDEAQLLEQRERRRVLGVHLSLDAVDVHRVEGPGVDGAQGQGYMTEALRAIYAWAFDTMGVDRIEAQVHPLNTPSLVLLKKLGFVEEGLLREAGYWMGERRDLVQLGLLRREFVRG